MVRMIALLRVATPANAVLLFKWIEVFFGSSTTDPTLRLAFSKTLINLSRRFFAHEVRFDVESVCAHQDLPRLNENQPIFRTARYAPILSDTKP